MEKNSISKPNNKPDWILKNVLNPLVNGSGAIKVYDTLTGKNVPDLPVQKSKTGSLDWFAQTISQTAGAIVPFVVAGETLKLGMTELSTGLKLDAATASIITNESRCQIAGAGLYEALQKPGKGQTRLANAVGTMASFSVFEGGNKLANSLDLNKGYLNVIAKGATRTFTGAIGGFVNYGVSELLPNVTSNYHNSIDKAGTIDAMASGGLMNFALPQAQELFGRAFQTLGFKSNSVLDNKTGETTDNLAKIKGLSISEKITSDNDEIAKGLDTKLNAPEGLTQPLGATVSDKGINFAVYSPKATSMDLLLFHEASDKTPYQTIPMTKTGDVWHSFVNDLPQGSLYLYRASGEYNPSLDGTRFNVNKALLDPYAKAITGDYPLTNDVLGYDNSDPNNPNRDKTLSNINDFGVMPKAIAVKSDFDWENDKHPNIDMNDSIIYELNLRAFTNSDASLGPIKGTYKGLVAKIPYLKDLGVTAVELMPIFKFNRIDANRIDPVTGQQLIDSWGYNPTSHFAPEPRFATQDMGKEIDEFKGLVKEFHKNNMEVLLDVVFNHTAEGNEYGPTLNFKGLDNNSAYLLNPADKSQYIDHTGCGNTVNTNDPETLKYIISSLRYWVDEMHVDGFRFDEGPIFKYMPDNSQVADSPILQAIANDPVLSKVKLIAEPWSVDQYYLGNFYNKLWSEWNGIFRDTARQFVKSDAGQVGTLAQSVAGSPNMFNNSLGRYSVNFVTAHDGFTLNDLVSYDDKHNIENGQNNTDGIGNNYSWNCGFEGELKNSGLPEAQQKAIEDLRMKQIKNFLTLLMVSKGTPMLLYGDEIRRTAMGDNNAYDQRTLNNMPWQNLTDDPNAKIIHDFAKKLIEIRKAHNIGDVPQDGIIYHGTVPFKPDFSSDTRFLSWQVNPPNAKPLYMAFNSYWEPLNLELPPGNWKPLINTDSNPGDGISPQNISIAPRSAIVLEKQ